MLLIAHAGVRDIDCTLPRLPADGLWVEMVDTANVDRGVHTEGPIRVAAHSFLLLRHGQGRPIEPEHHAAVAMRRAE